MLINVGSKPCTAQGRAGIRSSFLIVWCCAWGRVTVSVSQPFLPVSDVGVFSLTQYVGVTQFVSGFLSKVVALCVAVY